MDKTNANFEDKSYTAENIKVLEGLEAVRVSIKKWAYEESLKVARIIPTSLGEDSIACGASALVLQQLYARG